MQERLIPAASGRKRRGLGPPAWVGWLFVLPGLLGLLVFLVLPMLASLVLGFTDTTLLGGTTFTGVDNFQRLARDQNFLASVVVTTIFVVVYTPLNIIMSTAMAMWLRTRLWGRSWLRVV